MPQPTMPLTPAASTDLIGKQEDQSAVAAERPFNLPPPAIQAPRARASATPTATATTHRPIRPAATSSPQYSLPPPPTRSRTIIQMTPQNQHQTSDRAKPASQANSKPGLKRVRSANNVPVAAKKQPSNTSAAGKKIARKTAHSVIERRRRSKMNEEFATLKGMIPACTDQEMHKLAILQASIDYLRYLEGCICDLKAANNALSTPLVQPQAPSLRLDTTDMEMDDEDDAQDECNDEDDEAEQNRVPSDTTVMEDIYDNEDLSQKARTLKRALSQSQTGRADIKDKRAHHDSAYTSPQSSTMSPRLDEQTYAQTHHRSFYPSSSSTLPSPAFGPQTVHRPQSHHSRHPTSTSTINSASISPTIIPSREQDEEATTALLMLNRDRRHSRESIDVASHKGRRGMSVRDLLTH